jgi:hypothetical protein
VSGGPTNAKGEQVSEMLQHFRRNLDTWDPALIDALALGRQVITFDNRGVAASSGTTPNTISQMASEDRPGRSARLPVPTPSLWNETCQQIRVARENQSRARAGNPGRRPPHGAPTASLRAMQPAKRCEHTLLGRVVTPRRS